MYFGVIHNLEINVAIILAFSFDVGAEDFVIWCDIDVQRPTIIDEINEHTHTCLEQVSCDFLVGVINQTHVDGLLGCVVHITESECVFILLGVD